MKKTLTLALMLSSAFCFHAHAASLFEAMSDAYRHNPTLQGQRAYLRSVDENVAISRGQPSTHGSRLP